MPQGFCENCPGDCCSEFTVYLTHTDIKRITQFVRSAPESFVVPYLHNMPSPYPSVFLEDYGKYVRLGLIRNDEDCVFLDSSNGRKKCLVHAYKPMVCITYPFSLNDSYELVPTKDYKCPMPWRSLSSVERQEVIQEINQFYTEFKEYKQLVKKWNSLSITKEKSFDVLLHFLTHDSREKDRTSSI